MIYCKRQKFRTLDLHMGDAPIVLLGGNPIFPNPNIELRSTEMTTQAIWYLKSELFQTFGGIDHWACSFVGPGLWSKSKRNTNQEKHWWWYRYSVLEDMEERKYFINLSQHESFRKAPGPGLHHMGQVWFEHMRRETTGREVIMGVKMLDQEVVRRPRSREIYKLIQINSRVF